MHFQFVPYLELAHCNCSSRNERNHTSVSTVYLTYRRWMWPFAHGAQRRCHPSPQRQNNAAVTIGSRVECTHHTVLFRKHQRAQEYPSFYALTSHFPSVPRYKRSTTRVAKSSDSDDAAGPTRARALTIHGRFINSLSLRQIQPFRVPSLLSISMALKRSCALSQPLCSFISTLSGSLPGICPTAPPSPLLPPASATSYFLLESDPSANFFARHCTRPPAPSRFLTSGSLLSQTTLVRSFLQETVWGGYGQ